MFAQPLNHVREGFVPHHTIESTTRPRRELRFDSPLLPTLLILLLAQFYNSDHDSLLLLNHQAL